MKKCILLLTVPAIMLFCYSCGKEEMPKNTCSVDNPTQDLPWLKTYLESLSEENQKYFYVEQANYQGQTVFILNNCCPLCDAIVPVYNCNGDLLCTLNSQECPDLVSKIKNRKIISDRGKLLCNF